MEPRRLPFLRLCARAVLIVGTVLAHTLRYAVGWWWLFLGRSGVERRRTWLGACVVAAFRDLGATFIKIGQIMSTRPDLVPVHVCRALESLQDDVGAFSFFAVRRTLHQDFGRPAEELFADLAPVPLASASVAQVHKARLADGRVVAVKVRRPDVVELCAFDLGVLRAGARVLGALPFLDLLSLPEVVDEFGRALAAQLDFRIEARHNRRFRENFQSVPDVMFPAVLDELSSERVLTMEFVEGRKVLEAGAKRQDPERLARLGLRALLKMIFDDGFVHADMHPGNVLITSDGRLALLDVGLVGELDDARRQAFGRFFAAWAQRDGDGMARIMLELAEATGEAPEVAQGRFEAFRADVIAFIGRFWGQRLGEVQLGRVLFDLLGILRRHRIRVAAAFTTVNVAIAMTEGIGRQLDPTLDLAAEALAWFSARRAASA